VPVPGEADVAIEVEACGICGSDLHVRAGGLALLGAAHPLWLGHEYAGKVVGLGAAVSGLELGDRVTAEPSAGCGRCAWCAAGTPQVCPERRFEAGGFAPLVRVPAHRVHRLPASCPTIVGALMEPLACAVHAVLDGAPPASGELCVVIGPGPIGMLVALVARAQGAEVAIVGRGRRPRRLELARTLGLDHVIDAEAVDARVYVGGLGDGAGAHQVFGCAGGDAAWSLGLALVRRRGRYTELALGGPRRVIDLDDVVAREITVTGAVSQRPAAWRTAIDLVAQGRIDPLQLRRMITATFPLEAWEAAFAAAEGRTEGKVVLLPGGREA
jgi:L-iditol 2-dehydrogenase